MKKLVALSALVLSFASVAARADLVGTTVNGTLTIAGPNQFSSSNPATISNATTEFSYSGPAFLYTTDFTSAGFTVTRTCTAGLPRLCAAALANGYDESFVDAAFAGLTLTTLSNDLALSNVTLTGTTLSFHGDNTTGVSTFSLTPAVAATPEPSSLALLGTGVLGVLGAVRRRFKA